MNARIEGWSPVQGRSDRPTTTPKAVRVTVYSVDGEPVSADTTWLPRSIATDLRIVETREDGAICHRVTATVPAWWVRQLDTRAGWQKQGRASIPAAQRPW